MRIGLICKFTVFIGLLWTASGYAASFDCKKAYSPTEKMVCDSSTLSNLDNQMAALYSKAKSEATDADALRQIQLAWIVKTRGCRDEFCLEQLYKQRIGELTQTESVEIKRDSAPVMSVQNDDVGQHLIPEDQPSKVNEAKANEENAASKNLSPLITTILGALTGIAVIPIVLVIFGYPIFWVLLFLGYRKRFKKSVPEVSGNRFVRIVDFKFLILVIAGFISALIPLLGMFVAPFLAKMAAIREAGVAYDAQKDLIEIPAGGQSPNSVAEQINPFFWLSKHLKRVQIPASQISRISALTHSTTTTDYAEAAGGWRSRTKYSYVLFISTAIGEWSITFSDYQKYSAASALISDVAGLG